MTEIPKSIDSDISNTLQRLGIKADPVSIFLNSNRFVELKGYNQEEDAVNIFEEARRNGFQTILEVGSGKSQSPEAIALAQSRPTIVGGIDFKPLSSDRNTPMPVKIYKNSSENWAFRYSGDYINLSNMPLVDRTVMISPYDQTFSPILDVALETTVGGGQIDIYLPPSTIQTRNSKDLMVARMEEIGLDFRVSEVKVSNLLNEGIASAYFSPMSGKEYPRGRGGSPIDWSTAGHISISL